VTLGTAHPPGSSGPLSVAEPVQLAMNWVGQVGRKRAKSAAAWGIWGYYAPVLCTVLYLRNRVLHRGEIGNRALLGGREALHVPSASAGWRKLPRGRRSALGGTTRLYRFSEPGRCFAVVIEMS